MNKIKEILQKQFWLIAVFWLVLIFASLFWLFGKVETNQFNNAVNTSVNQANKAVKQAANAQTSAANFDIERRAEDVVREKTITPKLDAARGNSKDSQAALKKARKHYDEKKHDTTNLSRNSADNCLALRRLFPDTRFAYCAD